jgi:hypothetical protein
MLGVLAWIAAVVVGLGVLLVALWESRSPQPRPDAAAPVPQAPSTGARVGGSQVTR